MNRAVIFSKCFDPAIKDQFCALEVLIVGNLISALAPLPDKP